MLSWGLLSKRSETCQGQMLPVYGFQDFRKVQNMSQDRTFVWKKTLKAAWVGPQVGRGWFSGNDHGGVNTVIPVDGDSDFVSVCVCRLSVHSKGKMSSASTSVWEKVILPALTLKLDNLVLPYSSLAALELLPQ